MFVLPSSNQQVHELTKSIEHLSIVCLWYAHTHTHTRAHTREHRERERDREWERHAYSAKKEREKKVFKLNGIQLSLTRTTTMLCVGRTLETFPSLIGCVQSNL